MAKIYARKYQARIDSGEITYGMAVSLVNSEVPEKWRADVIALLHSGDGED